MMLRRNILCGIVACVVIFVMSCRTTDTSTGTEGYAGHSLSNWNKKLTRVIISDVFSPPVCSRIYAYANIAAYEALIPANPSHKSFAGKLNDLKAVPLPVGNANINFEMASIIAFTTVSQKLLFNADAMKDMEDEYIKKIAAGIPDEVSENTISYGRAVGKHIIEWASRDGYLQRNSNPFFMVTRDPARWKPTPPDYMDAVEPNWGTLRPFAMDSSGQFRPAGPYKFDTSVNSPLHKEAMDVYNAVSKPGKDFTDIAKYWDCNPNVSVTSGHVTYFQQQISPGGHWIFIAASVADKEKYNQVKTAELISKVAISIADGFISCWEAKYEYSSIRPETYINLYIDKEWRPFIQTPPFPEYPSGHSVISSSAATMLTALVGDNYKFVDSAEVAFGRPARSFNSFREASNEASISRLYGGIHFLNALNTGIEEGRNVATYVVNKLE
ncbi:MAG: phosphatase PAP2 family protein [Chitinophagaceae bacterium]|nr:MAG: phosphatase PAP2 family protein [Chitinophagaceae bacterium]